MLCDNRKQSVGIQFKFGKIHQTLKGSHTDPFLAALFFEISTIDFSLTHIHSGKTFHARAFQDFKKLFLFQSIRHNHTWNIRNIYNGIQIQTVHKYDLAAVSLDQMLLLK